MIILDFDGVVVESVGIKDQAFVELYQDFPDRLQEIMDYHFSHNATIRYEQFKHIAENILQVKYTAELQQALSKRYSELVFRKIVACPFVEGAMDFLEHFATSIPLYLASISPEDELYRVLDARNIRHFFKRVFAHPWSKTAAFREILATENIDPSDAIYIGDMPEDYFAAQEANIFFIGRKSRSEFPSSSSPIFNNLAEIKNYLTITDS